MQFKQIKNDLMEALEANKPKTAPYDTEAQVVRVEGSTAWVHIPGGVDETPVAMTINASAGDTVRVRVGNGTAWLVGNDTAPPTDDTLAQKAIDEFNIRWAKIGTAIIETLIATGINADWINTGALVIYDDDNNEIFRADKTGKIFRWDMGFSAMNNLGILTFMEDSPYETQFINHASLRVINTFYRQSLGDYATELFAANGLRTGRVSRWDSYTINDEVVEVPVYEECGTYGSDGIELYDTSSGSRYRILFLEQKTPTANNSYSTAGSGLTVNNRSLEQWINEATAQISSGANMDSITKPGTYWSPNASISASITHTPFTDSAFQVTVKKFGSILVQIAWQNKQDSYIKYRIYTSNNSWGSWYALARGAGNAALLDTPTFTVTAANFRQTRARVTRSGNIVAVEVVLTAAKALSANTVYEMGRFNVNSGIVTPLYSKDGNQNVQNVYVSGTAPNYNILYVRPNVAIASGTAVEATGIFIT